MHSGAGLPAALALASPLSFPERPSQHPSTHLSEFFPRSVSVFGEPSLRQALPPRASPSFVFSTWSTVIACGPGLPPSSKLIGSTVSGPTSLLFQYVFRFLLLTLKSKRIHHVLPLSTFAAAVGLLMVITNGNCTHSSNLSCNTVARSVVCSCAQHTALAHPSFFRTEAQSSSDLQSSFIRLHALTAVQPGTQLSPVMFSLVQKIFTVMFS